MVGLSYVLFVARCTTCARQILWVHRLFPHIGKGGNTNCTAIWKSLVWLIDQGMIPKAKKLFLQVDGGAENVNETFLSFCAWLVQKGIFSTVSSGLLQTLCLDLKLMSLNQLSAHLPRPCRFRSLDFLLDTHTKISTKSSLLFQRYVGLSSRLITQPTGLPIFNYFLRRACFASENIH